LSARVPIGKAKIELVCDGSGQIADISGWGDGARRFGDGAGGTRQLSAGTVAGGFCVSREEHDFLFSIGDVDCDQRGVVGVDLCGGEDEEVAFSSLPLALGVRHYAGVWLGAHALAACKS